MRGATDADVGVRVDVGLFAGGEVFVLVTATIVGLMTGVMDGGVFVGRWVGDATGGRFVFRGKGVLVGLWVPGRTTIGLSVALFVETICVNSADENPLTAVMANPVLRVLVATISGVSFGSGVVNSSVSMGVRKSSDGRMVTMPGSVPMSR